MLIKHMIKFIVFCLIFSTFNVQVDYIFNGKFNSPTLSANTFIANSADNWTGSNFNLMSLTNQGINGQYIDLQESLSMNGSIEQTVSLPEASQYRLNFSYRLYSTTNPHTLKVLWNGVEYQSIIPNTSLIENASLLLEGNAGPNVLKFVEFDSSFNYGFYLDDVSLFQVKVNQSSQSSENDVEKINIESIVEDNRVFFASVILSIPLSQTRTLRILFMIADDFWLYVYNNRTYDGIINEILTTIMAIELMKFQCLDRALKLSSLKDHIPISNYTSYTMERIAQIEGSSSVLLDSNFTFFLYYCPENILACVLMFLVFKLLRRTRFGKYFIMYGFPNTLIAKMLLQSNLSYLTFACWAHLSHPFSFKFFDKISLTITILVLLFVTLHSFSSNFLVKVLLKQKSHFFRPFLNNSLPSFYCLTIKNILRAFIKGTIFFFFHYLYAQQMFFLAITQIFVIISLIYIESNRSVFKLKSAYICILLYNIFFALFNFALLLEELQQTETYKISEFLQDFKIILVFSIMFIIVLQGILDLVPKIKKKKKILQNIKVEKSHQIRIEQLLQNKHQNSSNGSKTKALDICQVEKLEGCHIQKKNNIKPSDFKVRELAKKKEKVKSDWKGSSLNKNSKEIPLVGDRKIKFVNKKKVNFSSIQRQYIK